MSAVRILIVTPWFPTTTSPHSGVFVLRDAVALHNHHDVRVIHLVSPVLLGEDAPDDHVEGIPVHRVVVNRAYPAHWARAWRTVHVAAQGADIVHTQAISGLVPFSMRRPAGNTPWVHTEHWSALTSPKTLSAIGRSARLAVMRLLNRPDLITVACERLAKPIRQVRRGPIEQVPCIVAPADHLVAMPQDPTMVRLIGVGSLVPRKGPLMALRTIAELRERGVTASLTWAGDGPQRAELLDTADELGLTDQLTLLGNVDDREVRTALDAADMLLLPTLGDNFCIVVAEALSQGRPVVSGSATGASEYTTATVGTFVVDQTPVAYADAVADLLARTQTMTAAEIAGTLGRRFWPETVAGQYTAIYEALRAARQ